MLKLTHVAIILDDGTALHDIPNYLCEACRKASGIAKVRNEGWWNWVDLSELTPLESSLLSSCCVLEYLPNL
jgi:hypothetical protein